MQLRRRHDLIPNLVETVKQYAGYERGVLERVVAGRTQALTASTPVQKGSTEATLGYDLRRLIAVVQVTGVKSPILHNVKDGRLDPVFPSRCQIPAVRCWKL